MAPEVCVYIELITITKVITMNYLKTCGIVLAAGIVVGCSTQHRTDYYQAVALSAEAHSLQNIARTNALAHMAATGDSSTKAAAVMALAMMKQETIRPAYIESEALSYTKALAAPIAGVAALLIQADLSNETNKQNNKTARAQISANSADQQALFGAIATDNGGSSETANLAITGLVDVATLGITTVESTGETGIDAVVEVSGNGMDGMERISNTGMAGVIDVSDTGMAGVIDISKYGTDAIILLEELRIPAVPAVPAVTVPVVGP